MIGKCKTCGFQAGVLGLVNGICKSCARKNAVNLKNPDQKSESAARVIDPKLNGIGGWLVLPAIGLVLGPIIGVVGLISALGIYSDVARAGYGGVYGLEITVLLGLLAFTIYAATLFFRKNHNTPRIIITLLIVSVAASVLLLVVESSAGAEIFVVETGKQLVRDIIGAAIWIPYFKKSERVKVTFVH